jgi:hypothetical protein
MSKKSIQPARRSPRRRAPKVSTFTLKYADTILAPLRRTEAAAATKLALAVVLRDGTIRAERTRIYGPTLRIEKPQRRGGAPARMVWVRIRDRDRGVVHEISVERGKVIEHVVNEYANPPFSDEEREDARRLISSDAVLAKVAARKDVGIEWFNPGTHTASPQRVIGARLVRIQKGSVIETIAEAEVEVDRGVLHERRVLQ